MHTGVDEGRFFVVALLQTLPTPINEVDERVVCARARLRKLSFFRFLSRTLNSLAFE